MQNKKQNPKQNPNKPGQHNQPENFDWKRAGKTSFVWLLSFLVLYIFLGY